MFWISENVSEPRAHPSFVLGKDSSWQPHTCLSVCKALCCLVANTVCGPFACTGCKRRMSVLQYVHYKLQISSSFLQFLAKLLYFVLSLNYKTSCIWQDAISLECVCVCIVLSFALLDENAEEKNNEVKQLLHIFRDGKGLSG